jgi:hypothetical protein
LIVVPRRNNALLELVLEGNSHGKELFESRHNPFLHSLINKQRISIAILANTNIDEDHLVPLQCYHHFFGNLLGKKRWYILRGKWVPIV